MACPESVVEFAPGDCGCPEPEPTCSLCTMPARNLTVSWTNSFIGPGSATLTRHVVAGVTYWQSACVNNLRITFDCPGGVARLVVQGHAGGGTCASPTASCSSAGANPNRLVLSLTSCSPIVFRYDVTSGACSSLAGQGYARFTITI